MPEITAEPELGGSFWVVRLTTGRLVAEYERLTDGRFRRREWLEDLIGTGDIARVIEVVLYTERGAYSLKITRPGTVFQLNQAMVPLLGSPQKCMQLIGRVDDDAGNCTTGLWDASIGELYRGFQTNVHAFASWRPGVTPLGALNLQALGVIL